MLCIVGPSLDAECESQVCAAIRATVQSDPARHGGVSGCCQLDEGVMGAGVMYHRAVPHEELVHLMKHSFALVNSSLSEGMCGSLLEALALSVPVLARAAPGNLELIRHKRTGLLFNSPQECVALAQTYLLDSNLRHHLVLSGKCYADQYHSSSTEHQLLGQTLFHLSKTF
jgi:glycosyltransferase involved in cell wall biosynthesis